MSKLFEELDYRPTPIGALSLRRRRELSLGVDVFEIKLGDEYLMSSLFTASEVALARLGLAALEGVNLEVIVGGLGLGYTAQAVLEHEAVGSLIVVEMLDAVIDWHQTGLLPLGLSLVADKRCRLVQGDFFAMARGKAGFDPDAPERRFDAVLVDIDHSPDALLDDRSVSFYQPTGLRALSAHIKPGGIFGLWSNEKPDRAFTDRLLGIFAEARAEPVTFHNPLQDRPFTQSVYLARTAATSNETETAHIQASHFRGASDPGPELPCRPNQQGHLPEPSRGEEGQ
jgi:spermidine synthase